MDLFIQFIVFFIFSNFVIKNLSLILNKIKLILNFNFFDFFDFLHNFNLFILFDF